MSYHFRLHISRALQFFRPRPQRIPLSVNELLSTFGSADIISRFNRLYYESAVAGSLVWRGIPLLKNPCDLWSMLELLQTTKPVVLIETGTHHGGSALFFSEMMALLGSPVTVITVDINPKWHVDPSRFGIISLIGYSTDSKVVARVNDEVEKALALRRGPVLVTLDSDHSEENVSRELALYAPFVSPDSYLIVEDTNINGHPASPSSGPGPWEAVEKFLATHSDFVADRNWEKHLLTFFPRGWLKRISPATRPDIRDSSTR